MTNWIDYLNPFRLFASMPSKNDHGAESPIIEPPDSMLSTRIFG